jgi:hypothetical protein
MADETVSATTVTNPSAETVCPVWLRGKYPGPPDIL